MAGSWGSNKKAGGGSYNVLFPTAPQKYKDAPGIGTSGRMDLPRNPPNLPPGTQFIGAPRPPAVGPGEPAPNGAPTWDGGGGSGWGAPAPDPYAAYLGAIEQARVQNLGAIDTATAGARTKIDAARTGYNAQASTLANSTSGAYQNALANVSAQSAPLRADLAAQGAGGTAVDAALQRQQNNLTGQNAAQMALMDRLGQVFNAGFADRQAATEQIAQGAKNNLSADVTQLLAQVASQRASGGGGHGGGGSGSSTVTAGDATALATGGYDYRTELLNSLGNLGTKTAVRNIIGTLSPDLSDLSRGMSDLKALSKVRASKGNPVTFNTRKAVKQISQTAKGLTQKAGIAQLQAQLRGY